MTLEGALEEGFEIENLARLINFLKQLAVDVTYVTEYQSKLAAEELPDQKEIVTYSVFDTAPRIGLDQLEALSLPVGGIVDDSFTLGALNAHLIEIYGEDAALGPVNDTVTEE